MKTLLHSGFAAFCLVSLAASPAQARPTPVTVTVPTSDYDLSDPADLSALNAKLYEAIAAACTDDPSLFETAMDRKCMRDAMAQAKRQIEALQTRNIAYNAD